VHQVGSYCIVLTRVPLPNVHLLIVMAFPPLVYSVTHHSTIRIILSVCLSSVNKSWQRNSESRLVKWVNVGHCFDLCHIYRQSVWSEQVANIGTAAPFPWRGKCPQVTCSPDTPDVGTRLDSLLEPNFMKLWLS